MGSHLAQACLHSGGRQKGQIPNHASWAWNSHTITPATFIGPSRSEGHPWSKTWAPGLQPWWESNFARLPWKGHEYRRVRIEDVVAIHLPQLLFSCLKKVHALIIGQINLFFLFPDKRISYTWRACFVCQALQDACLRARRPCCRSARAGWPIGSQYANIVNLNKQVYGQTCKYSESCCLVRKPQEGRNFFIY